MPQDDRLPRPVQLYSCVPLKRHRPALLQNDRQLFGILPEAWHLLRRCIKHLLLQVLDLLDEALRHLEGALDKLSLKGGESMAAVRCAVQGFGTVLKCAADGGGLLGDVTSSNRA